MDVRGGGIPMRINDLVVIPFFAVGASSGLDGYIKLWDLESGKMLKSIDGGPGWCDILRLLGLTVYSDLPWGVQRREGRNSS